jgi:hypothetical protein
MGMPYLTIREIVGLKRGGKSMSRGLKRTG